MLTLKYPNFAFDTASSHFISIDKLELPRKGRQFRRVNDAFATSLEMEMRKNPAGSYGALFVVAKDIATKADWKVEEKDNYIYEVLGGTHISLATKKLQQQFPDNPHFSGRMCRVYVGLTDESPLVTVDVKPNYSFPLKTLHCRLSDAVCSCFKDRMISHTIHRNQMEG